MLRQIFGNPCMIVDDGFQKRGAEDFVSGVYVGTSLKKTAKHMKDTKEVNGAEHICLSEKTSHLHKNMAELHTSPLCCSMQWTPLQLLVIQKTGILVIR